MNKASERLNNTLSETMPRILRRTKSASSPSKLGLPIQTNSGRGLSLMKSKSFKMSFSRNESESILDWSRMQAKMKSTGSSLGKHEKLEIESENNLSRHRKLSNRICSRKDLMGDQRLKSFRSKFSQLDGGKSDLALSLKRSRISKNIKSTRDSLKEMKSASLRSLVPHHEEETKLLRELNKANDIISMEASHFWQDNFKKFGHTIDVSPTKNNKASVSEIKPRKVLRTKSECMLKRPGAPTKAKPQRGLIRDTRSKSLRSLFSHIEKEEKLLNDLQEIQEFVKAVQKIGPEGVGECIKQISVGARAG